MKTSCNIIYNTKVPEITALELSPAKGSRWVGVTREFFLRRAAKFRALWPVLRGLWYSNLM